MIILTPDSVDSENVLDEISYAIDAKKHILPILLEEATVPLRLRRFQYVDFTSKKYEDGVEIAKKLLSSLIETPSALETENSPVPHIFNEYKGGDDFYQVVEQKAEHQISSPLSTATKPEARLKSIFRGSRSLTERLMVGGVVVAVLITFVVAFLFSGDIINFSNLFSEPTHISMPAPMILDASEARMIIENGQGKGIYSTAGEQYTIIELNDFRENSQPIPITLEELEPLIVGYNNAWCGLTQDILRDNLLHVRMVIKFDDIVASESNFVDDYVNVDGLECFTRRIVISGWKSGAYFVFQEITLTQSVNNGLEDKEPFSDSRTYIVTVP